MRRGCLKYSILLFLLLQALSTATIRYVSKTGSSTPPYLTWGTASDSIQKAINICNDGDTVVVGNGVYREYLKIVKAITLLGTSMDSTIIDVRGITISGQDSLNAISLYANLTIRNFHIYGNHIAIYAWGYPLQISYCHLENAPSAIGMASGGSVQNCIINARYTGIWTFVNSYLTKNNLIIVGEQYASGIWQEAYGNHIISENIIINNVYNKYTQAGIYLELGTRSEIRNNLVAGFSDWQFRHGPATDSVIIENNIFGFATKFYDFGLVRLEGRGTKYRIRNNILLNGPKGWQKSFDGIPADYNLYWNVNQKYCYGVDPGPNEIEADPMFINDTLPTGNLSFDFHLQKYSPAIDAGDPEILDIDGSRSDIGMYGGPLGEKYGYEDLAPKTPKGLTAVVDTFDIKLKWKKNTEADFFKYRLFSDTIAGFTADSTTLLSELTDTIFTHPINQRPLRVYYKIAAIDSLVNQSALSSEIGVVISSAEDENPGIIQEYELYQNYPNPFNPQTRIPYRLKEGGMVRIVIYDITGQRVASLVNEYKEAGYHEEEFKITSHNDKPFNNQLDELVSGIYLYRIEVIGEGNIPVYNEMRKMVILK